MTYQSSACRLLLVHLICRRLRDLRCGPVVRRRALDWFRSADFVVWCDLAHLPYQRILERAGVSMDPQEGQICAMLYPQV